MEKMDYEVWEAKYKPVSNQNYKENVIEFDRHEVQGFDNSRVWSLVHGDFEETIITGYHLVNVVHFYVTVVAHDFSEVEVPFWTEEDERERLAGLLLPRGDLTEEELNSMPIDDLFELEDRLEW